MQLKRRRILIRAVVVVGLLIVTGIAVNTYRSGLHRKQLLTCMGEKKYDTCFKLAASYQNKGQFNKRLHPLFMSIVEAKLENMPAAEGLILVNALHKQFPKVDALNKHIARLKLGELRELFKTQPNVAAAKAESIAKQYSDDAELLFELGLLHASEDIKLYGPAIDYFSRAIDLKKRLYKEQAVLATVVAGIKSLPSSEMDKGFKLMTTHFEDDVLPILIEGKDQREAFFWRNNSFFLLNRYNKIEDGDVFRHHWLNLLDARSEAPDRFQAALTYFSAVKDEELPEKLDFSYFPILSQIPNQYTRDSLKMLLTRFPEQTKEHLQENLKDKKQHWPRVNSFYALQEADLLSKIAVLRYHRRNLSITEYDHFFDWLADSIDYFSKRGGSGKGELRTFVRRISRLRTKHRNRGDVKGATVYKQIEAFTRPKIGKRI